MKEQVAQYYEDTRKYYSLYHNHKETSAWAGLILYVLFCSALTKIASPSPSVVWFNIGFSVFVIVIAFLIFFYVKNQFSLKEVGAAHTAAATFLLAEIMMSDASKFDTKDFMEIEESDDVRHQASHCLPKKLLSKSKVMKTRGGLAAFTTKALAYGIIFVITLGVLLNRWYA